jgi:hypothetical protein
MDAQTNDRRKPDTKLYAIDLRTRFTTHFNETGKKTWTFVFRIYEGSLLNPILLESGLPA